MPRISFRLLSIVVAFLFFIPQFSFAIAPLQEGIAAVFIINTSTGNIIKKEGAYQFGGWSHGYIIQTDDLEFSAQCQPETEENALSMDTSCLGMDKADDYPDFSKTGTIIYKGKKSEMTDNNVNTKVNGNYEGCLQLANHKYKFCWKSIKSASDCQTPTTKKELQLCKKYFSDNYKIPTHYCFIDDRQEDSSENFIDFWDKYPYPEGTKDIYEKGDGCLHPVTKEIWEICRKERPDCTPKTFKPHKIK